MGGGLANARLVLRSVAVLEKESVGSPIHCIITCYTKKRVVCLPDEKCLVDDTEAAALRHHNETPEEEYLKVMQSISK